VVVGEHAIAVAAGDFAHDAEPFQSIYGPGGSRVSDTGAGGQVVDGSP